MIVIGITGGVASGKSVVAQSLEDLGARAIRADQEGHAVLELAEVQQILRQSWGDDIFRADQTIDRAAIARRVFAPPPDGPRELAFLEQVTHPRIEQRLRALLRDARRAATSERIALDAALLHEAGWAKYCDWILFVDSPEQPRRERAARRGWSAADFAAREAAQWPLERKRRLADVVMTNSGTLPELWEQVTAFWRHLPKPVV